jgi:arginine N-succinyltransferase
MFVIRPIKEDDLDGLMELLKDSGHGLTSLPKDRDIIKNKILISQRSFDHRGDRPNGESYLFVMEELFTGKIVGVSGIISKIGGFEPYYFYRLHEDERKSDMLGVTKNIQSLHFEKIHSGPAEICSLFLSPEFRNSQNGRFLSLSRFLFMAEDRKYFEDKVIAEMRGRVNDQGHSPFWEAVGRKFMDIDFAQADYLTMRSKRFIEELLPEVPILVDLLPKEAQDVVAEVHPHTEPAKRILEQEGFTFSGLVGIFEPGPVIKAELDEVRAVKESKVLEIEEISQDEISSEVYIISTSGEDKKFKACLGKLELTAKGNAKISAVTATALKLRLGEKLRYVSLKKSKQEQKELF